MIGGCVLSGKYNMSANLYTKSSVQNPNTGQVKSVYTFANNFSLVARGLANLRGKDSGTLQDYGNKLDEYHYLRIKTMQRMDEGDVVFKILDANGQPYLNSQIQFVVLGVTPTYDPMGSFMEYDIICNKSETSLNLPDNIVSSSDSTAMVGSEA